MLEVKISVIICTYDPPEDVFERCLQSVVSAAKVYQPLEILIIDNNSPRPLCGIDCVKLLISTCPNARVISEPVQGLTSARLRGIKESVGNLLIFIDDDNFVDSSYFLNAKNICTSYPFIGAYSGQVSLTYDTEPEAWTKRYWGMLIFRPLSKDVWSNLYFNNDTMPSGAGLCVTRDAALHYLNLHTTGSRNFNLDRSKHSLLSGGDNDLAMCACDVGKGMGLFRDLHLKHYIPQNRFTLKYLTKLTYGIYYSSAILLFMREAKIIKPTLIQKFKYYIQMSLMKSKDRAIYRASRLGLRDANRFLSSYKRSQK